MYKLSYEDEGPLWPLPPCAARRPKTASHGLAKQLPTAHISQLHATTRADFFFSISDIFYSFFSVQINIYTVYVSTCDSYNSINQLKKSIFF